MAAYFPNVSSTMSMFGSAPQTMFSTSSNARKRRAASPEAGPGPSSAAWSPDTPKRRRPNLANGFQAMSISTGHDGIARHGDSTLALGENYAQGYVNADDYGLEPTQPPIDGDVAIEVLPDHTPHLRRKRFLHRQGSSSSNSPSDDDDCDSDATFRLPAERARRRSALQPSAVEHPPSLPTSTDYAPSVGPIIEVFEHPVKRKNVGTEDGNDGDGPSKRRKEVMDVDVDALPRGSYGRGWYEPEKDRIIVTSLSSPESSPPQSPDRVDGYYDYQSHRHLAQPGNQGFTISPSLLTHIINAQRDDLQHTPPQMYQPVSERGLVLYRPLGVQLGETGVRNWNTSPYVDDNRFEEVEDDESSMVGNASMSQLTGEDVMHVEAEGYGPGGGSPWMEDEEGFGDDEAMEIE